MFCVGAESYLLIFSDRKLLSIWLYVSGTHHWEEVLQVLFSLSELIFWPQILCKGTFKYFSRSVSVSCCMIVQHVWLWLIHWIKLIEWTYRKPLLETIQLNGWIFTAQRVSYRMLPLLLTTGSDRKPVWLLLEATSSDRMKKKNVKTVQLFSIACPPPCWVFCLSLS